MKYKVGFPIDGGDVASSAIVIVRLKLAIRHYCKEGQSSGLREKSGAAFVFKRLSSYMMDRYRFEFEMKPHISDKIAPDNIADIGYSDAVACALATINYRVEEKSDSPLILVSMSFTDNRPELGFSGLFLEKVTVEEKEISKASLRNKWEISKNNGAAALVLHENDAQLLKEYNDVKIVPFSKNVFKNCSDTVVVSCKSQDFPLLLKSLTSDLNTRKIKRKRKIFKYTIPIFITILTAIFIVSLFKQYRVIPYHKSKVEINALIHSPQKYQIEMIVKEPVYIYLIILNKNKRPNNVQEVFPDSSFNWGQKTSKGRYLFPSSQDYFIKNINATTPIFCFYSDQPLSKEEHFLRTVGSISRPHHCQFYEIRKNLYLIIFPLGVED